MSSSFFQNSVLLITGAASGIGQQLAMQGAARGAAILATDIDSKGLSETKNTAPHLIDTHVLNVADPVAIQSFAAQIIPELSDRTLILINNAGVGLFTGSFEHTSLDDFEWLLSVNLWGPIRMTKAFYPYLLQQNRGHIVNISSVFGLAGVANQSAYCTSKFGVRGFTESLRMELLGTGIHTTSVHPGGISTNIVRNATPRGPVATAAMHQQSISTFEQAARTTPEKAARLILEAIETKKERLVIGPDGRALDWVTRLLPVRYTRIIMKQIEKTFTNPYNEKSVQE
ncbi:SDR family oxidoreductase [Telluribacter sp. SYSU D00476]|uniref:SDR family NAD(P)-dependent oxidoreductase n=1 Tax=Telluribacter sp. SYSU D00476 TaxID=2811430 RepID=UPI001FF3F96C|nr:SDR family NAD(P)-dependent oxidoreductase [Telluribacter sp. SYSU D00476]